MRTLALLAAAAFAATAAPASADIVFGSQSAGQGEEVLFGSNNLTGPSLTGTTNQSGTQVTFETLTGQTLTTPANGQANISAVSGETAVPLTSLNVFLTDLTQGFTYIEFDMSNAGHPGDATQVTVTGFDQFNNPFSLTYGVNAGDPTLSGGANWLSLTATMGQVITNVAINNTGNNGFSDIEQFRISGFQTIPSGVPEPATWAMMLLGFGAAGVAMRRTRKNALLAQIA
jgi:hypothetical protein